MFRQSGSFLDSRMLETLLLDCMPVFVRKQDLMSAAKQNGDRNGSGGLWRKEIRWESPLSD